MHFNLSNRIVLVGSSGSGKTQFISNVLKNQDRLFDEKIDSNYYLTSKKDFAGGIIESIPNIKIIEGLELDELPSNSVVVLDDLMLDGNLKNVGRLFIADARHRNIASFFVLHNLYPNDPHARTITLNATHFIIFRNLRDRLQFAHFARQLTPHWRELVDIYEKLSLEPFSPLVIDLDQTTPSAFRFKSDILNSDFFTVYCTKDDIEKNASNIFQIEGQSAYIVEHNKCKT